MDNKKIQEITSTICIVLAALLCGYIVYRNYPPFGADMVLTGKQVSELSPNDRVIRYLKIPIQISDIVYFNTKSEGYDSATVNITFKTSSPDREIRMGYKDQPAYHYNTQPFFAPFIENLKWFNISKSPPFLYQKNPKFISADQFFRQSPKSETVGTYNLNEDDTINLLSGYAPKQTPTIINVPLRGSHTFYTFIHNEPFNLAIQKQDLNWYDGADEISVKVFKDGTLLTEKKIADDGVIDNSRKVTNPLVSEINYTEGLPTNGVYKIVISSNGDSVIKSIKSSFSKIVFQGPIYPINNSSVYDANISGKNKLTIYTDSTDLNFVTYHQPSLGQMKVDNTDIALTETTVPVIYTTQNNRSIITGDKGDVNINGNGLFAFSKDQFFTPFIYRKHEIKQTDTLDNIDYVLTDYVKTQNTGDGWKTQEINFDLANAYYSKGSLSWIISAPNLKNNGGKIQYKEIKVTLHKKPIFNFGN